MAESTKQYWKSVRVIASKLDPEAAERDANETDNEDRMHIEKSLKEIWLVSVANEQTGGIADKVVSAVPWIAARWLKEGTHVVANEHQIAAHKADLSARKDIIEREEADRKGAPTSKLIEALIATQTAGGRGRKGE